MPSGLLVALPLDSVLLRVVLVAAIASLLVRSLTRRRLRSAAARVAAATIPFVGVAAVVAATATDPALPRLLLADAVGGTLPVPVGDGYLRFAPVAATGLLAVWAVIAVALVGRRAARASALRHRLLGGAVAPSPRVLAVVGRLARALDLAPPRTVVAMSCPGGAAVIGVRRPILVLDRHLLPSLDTDELEGVIAHELAHVVRRDNLLALSVGAVRDVAFLVPGARWASRLLQREREVAADQLAVGLTGRPGALASGLLKVLDAGPSRLSPCAALAPSGGLVDRIALLLTEAGPSPRRQRGELAAVALAAVVAIAGAVTLPGLAAGDLRERDALGVLMTAGGERPAVESLTARAFDVYRRSVPSAAPGAASVPTGSRPGLGTGPEDRVENLLSCASDLACVAPTDAAGLGLRPRPLAVVAPDRASPWQATPVVRPDGAGRFGLYWLARLPD